MTPLGTLLADRIRREGPLTVREYMRVCLTHPEHGYYRSRPAVGEAGDFITAPEISQVFGELIGLWAAEAWTALGRPRPTRMVELGPGRGTLMADALRAIGKVAPDFRDALELHLVEINSDLRRQQATALSAASPQWHETFDAVPRGPLIVIANEFFDALPIRQLVRAASGWRERVVDYTDGAFCFGEGPAVAGPEIPAALGDIVETSPDGEALATAIAARVVADGGAALVIDYGPAARCLGDTFQAVQAHKKVSPLAEPGAADLTAHVDFAGLIAAARDAGAAAGGPVSQATLLNRLGIFARAATLLKRATPAQAAQIESGVRRLIEPAEMGTLFKAIAIATPRLAVPGFDSEPVTDHRC